MTFSKDGVIGIGRIGEGIQTSENAPLAIGCGVPAVYFRLEDETHHKIVGRDGTSKSNIRADGVVIDFANITLADVADRGDGVLIDNLASHGLKGISEGVESDPAEEGMRRESVVLPS